MEIFNPKKQLVLDTITETDRRMAYLKDQMRHPLSKNEITQVV